VSILRDTGSSQSLILKDVLDFNSECFTGRHVLIAGVSGQTMTIPLYKIVLKSGLLSPNVQKVVVGVTDSLPVDGVQVLMGNDLAGPRVRSEPVVSEYPVQSSSTDRLEYMECLPSCAVTRAQSRVQDERTIEAEREAKQKS
jgi:hypothetical protein